MNATDLLSDAFGRIRDVVHGAVEGLSDEDLAWRVDADANSIAWLIWHLTRIQDDHVAHVTETDQVWVSEGWADRFALPLPVEDHGYGHTPEQVAVVRASGELLTGYYDAVERVTRAYVASLADADLDRVVDRRWDPPVTLGVRLVSVIDDDVAHAAQAAYVRGVLERR
jgi:uncharacterized damage-inducible protein DinB